MPPRLVLCRCDPAWPAFAVCEDCELKWLEEKMAARDVLPPDHPAVEAYQALVGDGAAK